MELKLPDAESVERAAGEVDEAIGKMLSAHDPLSMIGVVQRAVRKYGEAIRKDERARMMARLNRALVAIDNAIGGC